ncbi:c-type cytochrome [Novosphingobium mathurense]|uniref:Cytochrome c, mono-and diheme variants n=1 Tax=Novosphingobium mathurense TaxID=428990 RepID=A0A1U6I5N2_9SPHN|nr:cytochrome c [Novosphingobium mathurense]SLK03321.1 Cytochrome c, mono-and diheme variants [Novosphingobium mathurense]
MKKILSILLALVVIVGLAIAWFVNRTPASPFDGVAGGKPSADLVKRGEYVARAADCVACHGLPGKPAFTGGLEMATPMGSIFATNITPDRETGIGAYSLADFDRAIRQGIAPGGQWLYPAMPYPSYAKLSDDDVKALYAFFMTAVPATRQENHESEIPWPLNMRWPLALWKAVFTDGGTYETKADRDAQWNRGAYLVQAAGHCGACHTPRGLAMNEKALDEDSDLFLAGAVLDGWYAPSLRGDSNIGLGRWSEDEIWQFLKTGRNRHAVVYGSMTEAFNNSLQFMRDEDLRAMAHYLKSLPGNPRKEGEPWQYDASSNQALALANRMDHPGAQTYMAKCSFCHGADGRGQGQWIPPLAGSASAMTSEGAPSAINITLNGSQRVVAQGVPDAYRMPPYRNQLSDGEIADALSFVRTAWGNRGGSVSPGDVADLRKRTDPASSQVIILQMR